MDNAQKNSWNFLSGILDNIADPVFVKGRQHHWVFLNDAFCKFIGHPLGDLLGKSDYDFFPKHQADVFRENDELVFNSGLENVNEEEFSDSDGITHAIITKKTCYTAADGQQFLVGVIRDVSERKRMEAELVSQANFQRTLLDALSEAGEQLMVIENGRVIHVGNRELARQFGYTDAELDAHPALLDFIHPDDRARVADNYRRRLAGEDVPASYELGLITRDGQRREYETSVSIVPDSNPVRIVTIGKDITARKRLEDVLKFIAQGEWLGSGEEFLTALARYLGKMLGVDYVIIDKLDADPAYAETVAIYAKGEVIPNMRYSLEGTPCENVMGKRFCCYAQGIQQRFPDDTLLVDMQVESYTGIPLLDTQGKVIGLIALMDGKPMSDTKLVSSVLQEVAASVAAELSRRQIEEALASSEREFRTLAENSPDPIYRYDRDGRRLYVNAAVRKLSGKPVDELVGKSFKDDSILVSDQRQKLQDAIRRVFDSGENGQIDLGFITRAGDYRDYQMLLAPERDALGQVATVLAIARDITAMRSAERRVSHFLSNLPGFIYSFRMSPGGHFSFPFASQGIEEIYGLHPEDVKDDMAPLHALAHPEDAPRIEAAIAESARTMTLFMIEVRVRRPGRPDRWIECRALPERDADGGILWHGIMLDIDERKRLERALKEREREFRTLAENIPDNIARWDAAGRYLYINPTHERTLGALSSEIIGTLIPDLHGQVKAAIAQVVATGQRVQIEQRVLVDGSTETHLVSLTPEFDADGQVVSVLGIGRDLTDIYRMQESLAAREHEFRNLAESSPDVVIRVDRDLRIRYLNANMVKALELGSAEEVIGRQSIEVWTDGRFNEIDALRERVVTTGKMDSVELAVPAPGGKMAYHHVISVPERDTDGHIIGTLTFGRDITAIRETERRLSGLVENLPGIAYTLRLSPQGEMSFPYVSAGVEEIYGITPEAAMGDFSAMHGLIHPDDKSGMEALFAESMRTLTQFRVEMRICPHGLPERWLDVRSDPQAQPDGCILWYGLIFDITERKQVSEQLISSRKMLADAQKLALLGSWDWDVVSNRVEWSEMAYEIYTPDKRPAEPGFEDFKSSLHPDDLERVVAAVQSAFEHDTPFDLDHRVVSVSKGVRTVHAQGKVFRDANGKPVRMVGTVQDITERVLLEQELRLKEFSLDHAGDAVYLINRDQRFVYVNEEACRSLGYSREELLAMGPFDIDPVLTQEDTGRFMEQMRDEGGFTFETLQRRRDGSLFQVEIRGSLFEYQGQMISMALASDITERKRLEAELIASEREFRTLAENMPDVIVRYDRDCRRIYANQQYALVNGIPFESVLGRTPQELSTRIAPMAPAYQEKLQRLIESGEPFETELSWPGKGGNKVIFDLRAFPEFGTDGKVASVLTVAQDVSALRQMEDKLRTREREFRTLAENSPDTIVRFDRDCRFAYANPLFEKVMGFRLDELRGKMPTQVPGLPDAEFFQQRVQEVIETGRMDEFEHAFPVHDGMTMWKLVSIFPELDTEGRLAYVQVLSRDISTLKETERQLEESRARLRQLLAHQEDAHEQERKKISWDMHEELLQILAALQMYVTMLQSSADDLPERFAKTLPVILSGANQSILLVREMVTSLRPTVLNLGILAALEWLVEEFAGQHPDLVCKLEADKEAVQMDEKSVLLVFRIAQESLVFTAKYKTSGKVSVTLECDENGYLLVVCDKSKGNNVELSDTDFLGLYGLQERVLAMGGEMVVFSAPDHGLIMEARLPVHAGGSNEMRHHLML